MCERVAFDSLVCGCVVLFVLGVLLVASFVGVNVEALGCNSFCKLCSGVWEGLTVVAHEVMLSHPHSKAQAQGEEV